MSAVSRFPNRRSISWLRLGNARVSRILRRRESNVPRECDSESACGTVADVFGNVGDSAFILPQQILCKRHAPREEVFHGGEAHGAIEPHEECRPRERCFLCELRNRPWLPRMRLVSIALIRRRYALRLEKVRATNDGQTSPNQVT